LHDFAGEAEYRAELYRQAEIIVGQLRGFIREKSIDFLIPQNVWSVAVNPPAAIALTRVMCEFQLPALAHHHDFYFERTGGISLTCNTAIELADLYLPPRGPLVKHVVINSLARRQLLERKGLPAAIVPNVFDFDAPPWELDDFNRDLRRRIGLREDDVMVLQATRIVARKGIELAVDFVHALNSPERRAALKEHGLYDGRPFTDDSRIVLVLAGHSLDDVTGDYRNLLAQKAESLGVEAIFIERMVGESRTIVNGEKIYSLWDTYVHADFISYPSLWEGWGNQLLEALRAKVPLMLFEYPVYQQDIKSKGLQVVSLSSEIAGRDEDGLVSVPLEVLHAAADQAVTLLTDTELRQQTVDYNYRLGKKHFSMDALYIYLEQLMQSFETETMEY
jgi:glycosyltransferase involved in cell wall biosynthesis